MVLLDTNIVSLLQAGEPGVLARLQGSSDPDIRVSIVTRCETMRGRIDFLLKASGPDQFLRAQEYLLRSEEHLATASILPLDRNDLAIFEKLSGTRGLKKIGRGNLLIAAQALSRDATLVSRNVRDFQRIPGLALETWKDE